LALPQYYHRHQLNTLLLLAAAGEVLELAAAAARAVSKPQQGFRFRLDQPLP
jgi:hypothetical protein